MCRDDFRNGLPVLALLCILHASSAQTVRVFDTESGLPHNRVNRIYLDSKGFLWICTDDGLSRFDGHQSSTTQRPMASPTSISTRYWRPGLVSTGSRPTAV